MDEDSEYAVRYSADLGRHGGSASVPPGDGEIERVRDVLLIPGDPSTPKDDPSELIMLPKPERDPATGEWMKEREPIDLGRGLRIERPPQSEANLVMNACSPRGHYFVPVRQFGQMYSLVVDVPTESAKAGPYAWNAGGLISDALTMSRLVLDNGYSYEYAARIFDYEGGGQSIFPPSVGLRAYRLRKTRDWLTEGEAEELRKLLGEYWTVKEALPDRVQHALWMSEYLISVRWLDVIGPLLVVGLEGMISTSTSLVRRQFRERVVAMTQEAGAPLDDKHCRQIYDARSRFVHGERVSLYARKGANWVGPSDAEQQEALERIARTEDSLRAVVRRCIENKEFREIFQSEESIRARWPVVI